MDAVIVTYNSADDLRSDPASHSQRAALLPSQPGGAPAQAQAPTRLERAAIVTLPAYGHAVHVHQTRGDLTPVVACGELPSGPAQPASPRGIAEQFQEPRREGARFGIGDQPCVRGSHLLRKIDAR